MGCVNRAAPSAAGLGANLSALRGYNAALVLGLLRGAREHGVSRVELAERTGLTPQAVSKITARLRAEGLVTESGHTASTGGKPPTVLRLVSGARQAVGLHLDRDELTAVLVDLTGESLALRTSPLDFGAGSEGVLDAAAEAVAALVEGRVPGGPRLVGVGVAAPGPLDHRLGVLHRVTGFPQGDGFPLRDALAERLGLPVALDKDTHAAVLGLALDRVGGPGGSGWTAPGQAVESFAYLHMGTGLGAGAGARRRCPPRGADRCGRVRAPGGPTGRAALRLRQAGLRRGVVPGRGGRR